MIPEGAELVLAWINGSEFVFDLRRRGLITKKTARELEAEANEIEEEETDESTDVEKGT